MSEAIYLIAIYWLAFTFTHVLGSHPPVRKTLISIFSLGGFKAVYSIISLVTFLPLIWIYSRNKHSGDFLFPVESWMEPINHGLMFLALVILIQGVATPNPMTTLAEMTKMKVSEPRGVHRWTRHPMNLAFLLFGLAHILTNPFSTDLLFFGGFLFFTVLTALHQDHRMRVLGDENIRSFMEKTSFVPFLAVIRGKQKFGFGEMSPWTIGVSILLFVLIRGLHPILFGGFQ